MEEFFTLSARDWDSITVEYLVASTTALVGWEVRHRFLASIACCGHGLEGEDSIVDALDVFGARYSSLLKHWEQNIFSKPYWSHCGIWHHETTLDLD